MGMWHVWKEKKCTQAWEGGNPKNRDHFGKYKSGREDNIKMNLKEI